eukprot:1155862-Pelagomonas_calceolata.AAC.2
MKFASKCPLTHHALSRLSSIRLCAPHTLRLPKKVISNMRTKFHNAAGGMITKTLSKSPWEASLVKVDIGNDNRPSGSTILTARVWSRVLLATLQVPTSPFVSALWWRRLTPLLSQCVSLSSIDGEFPLPT